MKKINNHFSNKIRDEILNFIEPDIYYCYQCGRCTAGCPLSNVYKYQPNQIIRLIAANKIESIFNSNSIYLCLSCEICSSRCPQEIDIAAIMNYLRIKSWERRSFKEKAILNFYKAFLKIIGIFGRSYEPALIMNLNLLSGKFFNDMDLALNILRKKKIKLFPEFVKDRAKLSKLVKKYL
ncbi:MAG: 4Fe-4S dicluster domain-containing protein [Actinobacteria bacterium]|nr:4Fe-4S dicluster domain-containing protein [Actinomycetota bacterium]